MRGLKIVLTFMLVAWATAAIAGRLHYGSGATQKEAMVAATELARADAARRRTCYRPAWVVNVCTTEPGIHICPMFGPCWGSRGPIYTCRAETAEQSGSCGHGGYLSAGDYGPPRIPEIPVYPFPTLPQGPGPDRPCDRDAGPCPTPTRAPQPR